MKKSRKWQIIYAVCSLVYMGWVIQVGDNEFDRINSQHRRLTEQLHADRIKSAALEELIAECRRESRERFGQGEDGCSTWSPLVVETRGKIIEERRIRAREKGTIKLILFYAGFVVLFLLGPVILTYLLIFGIIKVYKSVKFVR